MRIDKNTTIKLGDRNIVKIKIGDSVIWEKKTEPEIDYFYIESLGDGNTVSVVNEGNGDTSGVTPTLEYSTDKNTWNTITFDWTSGTHTTELPILNTGEKMYFRNDTRKFSKNYNKRITFSSSVSSNVGGDIRTLSNYLDVDNETTPQIGMFYNLFYGNGKIVDASNLRLPYTTLAINCYSQMFSHCSSLTTTPTELPATNLAIQCYSNMFNNCTSLTTAPTELPATRLKDYCYVSMFKGCSKLTTSPQLLATTLAHSSCNQMFYECISLQTSPTLFATTLTSECYRDMFYRCSKLKSITVYADDISASYCTKNWLLSVSSSGTLHNLGSATYVTDSGDGIPTGWVEVKE